MSLKSFHIVFIALAAVLSLVFAGWEFGRFLATGDKLQLVAAVVAVAMAAGLVTYGIRFLKKLRKVSFI